MTTTHYGLTYTRAERVDRARPGPHGTLVDVLACVGWVDEPGHPLDGRPVKVRVATTNGARRTDVHLTRTGPGGTDPLAERDVRRDVLYALLRDGWEDTVRLVDRVTLRVMMTEEDAR